MQNIINTLLLNPDNYFWSKSEERPDKIILGGNDSGRNLGEFEFEISNQSVTIERSITSGVTWGLPLSPATYSKQTLEYDQLKKLLDRVDDLLINESYLLKCELNRTKLLENTFALLSKYSEVEM